MPRKRSVLYGLIAIALTAFILFIAIMQNNSNNSPKLAQKGNDEVHNLIERETNVTLKKKDNADLQKLSLKTSKKESSEEKNDGEQVKKTPVPASTMYVTVSSLNIRSGPGSQNDVVGVATINQSLSLKGGESTNGWVQVSTDSLSGYVNINYLADEKVIFQATKNNKSEVSNQDSNSNTNKKIASKSTEKKVSNEKKDEPKAEKPKKEETKPAPKNDADKLTSVAGNNQLILVTSNGYGTSSATIQTFERDSTGQWKRVLNTSGFIGKNGFAGSKAEGDGKSPTGKYSIGTAFGRSGNPGTNLPFRNISADDVWVDDSNSGLYNSWQSKKETNGQWSSAENMDISLYTYGFVINYNTARTPGKGSAIFFHVASGHTLGCTGVSQGNMVSILKWINPARNPVIIQTPVSELNNY